MDDLKEGFETQQKENAATESSMYETTSSASALVDAASEEVSADADLNGEVAQNNTPVTTGFASALAAAINEQVADDQATYLALEEYSGASFSPSTDENRPVTCYVPVVDAEGVLRMKRTGKSESQGGYVHYDEVTTNFGFDVSTVTNKTQVSLVLANGKMLVGYTVKGKTRLGFYFPRKLAEVAVVLPPIGKRLPVKVNILIVG